MLDMTIREFLALCESRGWHFTVTWVSRRLRDLEKTKP